MTAKLKTGPDPERGTSKSSLGSSACGNRELSPSAPVKGTLRAWVDYLVAVLALIALGLTLVPDYARVESVESVACDFKTLYAAVALNAKHQNPYQPDALGTIYRRDGVVLPATWFGRMPVYPPGTLDLLAPLAAIPMAEAARIWLGLSVALGCLALCLMLRFARRRGAGQIARLVMVGSFAGLPLLAGAWDLGNVSAATSSLAISALMLTFALEARDRTVLAPGAKDPLARILLPGALLGLALCLKPHVAIWIFLSLLLFACRRAMRIATAAAALAACETLLSTLHLLAEHRLLDTYRGFFALLNAEQASGASMSANSREVLAVTSQVTSAASLFGLWPPGVSRVLATAGCLLLVAGLLLAGWRRGIVPVGRRLLFSAALCGFGLIATYHRAHDGTLLLLGVLWLCVRAKSLWLRRSRAALAWSGAFVAALLLSNFDLPRLPALLGSPERQAALAMFLAALSLSAVWVVSGQKKDGMNGALSMPGGQ